MKPRDQRVGMNGIAKFECVATGNPPPSVFWTKEGSQELMFAGTTHGQMFVSQEGTLTIQVIHSQHAESSLCTIFTILLTFLGKSCIAYMLHASGVYYSYMV